MPLDGDEEFADAFLLGCLLAQNNYNVCTGGYRGIMEAVSKGVTENGGEATGVTLTYNKSEGNKYLTREIKCASLFERIKTLIEKGDAYIILQGGTGTLLELAAVWEFMNKGLIPVRPIACHSIMWKEIGAVVDKQLEREKRVGGLVRYFSRVEDIADYLKTSLSDN